jgi:hypothetical protein
LRGDSIEVLLDLLKLYYTKIENIQFNYGHRFYVNDLEESRDLIKEQEYNLDLLSEFISFLETLDSKDISSDRFKSYIDDCYKSTINIIKK